MSDTQPRRDSAPPTKAEQLSVEKPEDYDGIEVGRPTPFPRFSDKVRWERWFDSFFTATIAATIVATLVLLLS